jgi:hypothetical protein
VASRFLTRLADKTPLLSSSGVSEEHVLVDVDDTIIEVHGYAKKGAGFGYRGVRGLNALLATVTTPQTAPVVVAQRVRKGSCGSPRGAKRLVTDALKTRPDSVAGQTTWSARARAAFTAPAIFLPCQVP